MKTKLCLSVVAASLALLIVPAEATTIHVPGDEPTIQAAINAASYRDTVELADGSFTGDGNRDMSYFGKAITVRSQSGDPITCVIDCQGSHGSPHRAFHFYSGEGPNSILEGVTVTGGYADVSYDGDGGGIYCDGSSPTIANCIITGNTARNYPTNEYGAGGGLYCVNSSSPTLIDCVFSSNYAGSCGGGAWLTSGSAASLTGCVFTGNSARSAGGLGCSWSDATLTDCTFSGNSATALIEGGNGGGMNCHSSDATLERVSFIGNSAGRYGGGLVCASSASPMITDCTFIGNIAEGHPSFCGGGALACMYSGATPIISGCAFLDNYTAGGSSGGCGGAMHCGGGTSPTITDCTFSGNGATGGGTYSGGGAIYCSTVSIQNCTFAHDWATCPGAVFYFAGSSAQVLTDCIIAFSQGTEAVACSGSAEPTLSCCDVFGNAGGDWVGCIADQYGVNGNFSEDPLFCYDDNPAEPLSLHEGSPCLPENSPCGELVGAFGLGCGPVTPVEYMSWGAIKAMFR